MTFRVTHKVKNIMLNALAATFSRGTILIYSGTQPANARMAATGTLLGRVTVQAGEFIAGQPTNGLEFDVASGGVLTKKSGQTWQYKGLADGTAGWFRLIINAGDTGAAEDPEVVARMDGRIGTTGAEMTLSQLNITLNAIGTIDTFEVDFSTWL